MLAIPRLTHVTATRRCLRSACQSNARLRIPIKGTDRLVGAVRNLSSYSSLYDPEPTLFVTRVTGGSGAPPIQPNQDQEPPLANTMDLDAQLRADIRIMGSLLGNVIQQHEGIDIFEKVERMRSLAKTWREEGAGRNQDTKQASDQAFADLAAFAAQLSDKELFIVSRAFTHFLSIANSAEGHHRGRRLQASATEESAGALFPKPDSVGGAIPDLLRQGHSPEAIYEALATQCTELVLTAHPTEVNRRTLLAKKQRIQELLTQADTYRRGGASLYDKKVLDDAMQREIASVWLSDEVSRIKPTPELEAEKNTLVLETVLWKAVPNFFRRLDVTATEYLGKGLPLDSAPIRFASWMGAIATATPTSNPTRRVT